MASAIAEAEAGCAKTNRRRISDYLADSDGGEASPPPPDTPPQLRLPRFTCARLRFGLLGRKRDGGGRKEGAAAEKGEDASVGSSGSSKQAAGSATSTSSSVAAGQAGVGLGMLLVLAARTCVELNRMAEVRAQMEALLREMRDEASRVKGAAVTPEPRGDPPYTSSTTASSSCISDTSAASGMEIARGRDESKPPAGDALDAEPGTEPAAERRRSLECSKRDDADERQSSECSSVRSSSDDEFIELEGARFGRGSGRAGVVVGDDDDSDGESGDDRNEGGVCAIELERRLHELRHRRDRERIEELEAALRRAERRLTEKEMEARLWQDTAALALGQPPPPRGQAGQ